MATDTKNTSGMVNYSTVQDLLTTLLTNINSGNIITATDINNLISAYNNFIGHYHTVNDLYGIWNYGDGAGTPYSSAGDYENTDPTSALLLNGGSSASSLTGVTAGDSITASKHNEIKDAVVALNNHKHTWDDRTS